MTEAEEDSLVKSILDQDSYGRALNLKTVCKKANLILEARGTTPCVTVSKNWPTEFVKRRPELSSRRSRPYDMVRAKREDPKIIRDWIERVRNTITRYGISNDDIYNFDETGFAMGETKSTIVVTGSEYRGRRKILGAGN